MLEDGTLQLVIGGHDQLLPAAARLAAGPRQGCSTPPSGATAPWPS
ncbi:MAG: hypothetical protein R3F43_30375 [bacterium]